MNGNDFEYMFELLYKERRDDLIRAVDARRNYEKREKSASNILSYYKKKVGIDIPPLSDYELEELSRVWGELWDYGVIKPEWYAIHKAKTGVFDPTIIGTDLHYYYTEWNKIDYDYLRAFLDKNYGDILFPSIRHPETILRKIHGVYRDKLFNVISLDKAVELLVAIKKEGAVAKISRISSGGKGVSFISEKNDSDDIRKILTSNSDIVVQAVVKQHPEMKKMNSSSVNTLRIISIMLEGVSIPLSTVVRIGKEGSRVDNFSSGGYACGVNDDGTLKPTAFDSSGKWYSEHTNGFRFSDGKVPNYGVVLEKITECHNRVPMFGVVSWDIAIDEDGTPIMIEYNVSQGQIDLHQYCNGPVYGKYREKIIEEVFRNYTIRNGSLDYNWSLMHNMACISKGSKNVVNLVIPSIIDDVPVREIASETFCNNNQLRTLVIDANLSSIGYASFYNCKRLESVVVRGTIDKLGRSCFNSCSSLQHIILPEGTKYISTMAFRNCEKLRYIYIPESVEFMEDNIFMETPNVRIICPEGSIAHIYAKEKNINHSVV